VLAGVLEGTALRVKYRTKDLIATMSPDDELISLDEN
jgi:hypothetical protein